MEQKRSRLVAPDATGLRARILSTGGLLMVAGMVVVVLVMLYPRQELIDRLQAQPQNDELSVSYLSNLLSSEPDNDELRLLLAERWFALKRPDRAEAVLQPMMRKVLSSEQMMLRRSRLAFTLLEQRANAVPPSSAEAQTQRARLVAGLEERVALPWATPELLDLARKSTALEQLNLAQRYYGQIHLDANSDQADWFAEAVRTALWAHDYAGAAGLHERALKATDSLPRQRAHLHEALTILQSGNQLQEALALAQRHPEVIGDDPELLRQITALSLAAGDYTAAAALHERAMQAADALPQQRAHLREALIILQSGNLLSDAMALAKRHTDVIGSDPELLRYMTRLSLGARDYTAAAALHERAIQASDPLVQQRAHLREALTVLQSGNLLSDALALAKRHNDLISGDSELLRYMTRLSLAANRPDVAQGYAKRLMKMSAVSPAHAPALAWLAAVVDLLVAPAQAAEVDPPAKPVVPILGLQPGDPRLPYDEATYNLAWQTFLANRNQNDAARVATAAVRQVPSSAVWRERLAQVSEWTGKPEEALVHWQALARMPGVDRATADRALQAILRLAPGLNDDNLLLSTWRQVGAQRRLTAQETMGVLALYERLGRPEDAMKWLLDADRAQPSTALLEARVDLADRMGDTAGTIDAQRELIRRAGLTSLRAVRLATLLGRRGETAAAYEAMVPLMARTPASDQTYWRLMANLAWAIQAEDPARRALTITTDAPGGMNSYDVNRLLSLLTSRDPRAAARFAERAWRELHQPTYLQAALNLWWNANERREVDRLFGSVDSGVEAAMVREPYFWMLRSQWRQSNKDMPGALADMRRALAAQPGQVDTRVSFLFTLMDAGAKAELARSLADWLDAARRDPAYDAAYAAGYMTLEQPAQALPFWRRQAAQHRDDPMWAASYADVLEGVGSTIEADHVRRYALQLTRQRLQAAAAAGLAQAQALSPEVVQSLRLQLVRLMLASDPSGDAQQRAMRELVGPGGLTSTAMDRRTEAAARELALGWMLSNEAQDQARLWLWRRYGRKLAAPAWAEITLALNEGDVATVRDFFATGQGDQLPPALRIDALHALGETRRAQALRIVQLELHDDDNMHETYTDVAWRTAPRIEYSFDSTRDTVNSVTNSLTLWLPWTETLRAGVVWQHAQQSVGRARDTGLPQLGVIPADDQSAQWLLQYRPDRTLRIDAALGLRAAESNFATGTLSGIYEPIPRLQLRADLGLNARATDTAPLAVAGVQQELKLGATLRLSETNPARATVRAARLGLQGGGYLGGVESLEWELGHVFRLADPTLGVRVFGQYNHYNHTGAALPTWTARLTPDGSQPGSGFFVPENFSMHGVGLSGGLTDHDVYTRAWRPFFDVSLTTNSQFGAGHALTVGAAGRLFDADQLLLQYTAVRAGASGDSRSLGLRYVLPF